MSGPSTTHRIVSGSGQPGAPPWPCVVSVRLADTLLLFNVLCSLFCFAYFYYSLNFPVYVVVCKPCKCMLDILIKKQCCWAGPKHCCGSNGFAEETRRVLEERKERRRGNKKTTTKNKNKQQIDPSENRPDPNP